MVETANTPPRPTQVTALVDWNSQIHAACPGNVSEQELATRTLDFVGRVIGKALSASDEQRRFSVTVRFYHGWHKGFEVMPRRKALISAAAGADFPSLSRRSTVSIRPEIEFGDRLNSAMPVRLHAFLNCHLPNTLRNLSSPGRKTEEKMVDTSIASDVVDIAHREPSKWIVVLGEDDDLVPPVFVAEPVLSAAGGKIILVRARSGDPFLKLQDLRWTP